MGWFGVSSARPSVDAYQALTQRANATAAKTEDVLKASGETRTAAKDAKVTCPSTAPDVMPEVA